MVFFSSWSSWAPLTRHDVTFISRATKSFPWGLCDFDQLQMWVTSGYEREEGPAVPVEALLKIAVVCECMCVYMWQGGQRNDSREKETCRRFDLWGSKHDNYYLPSKKLTTALRTSKHFFSFYYMIKQKMLAMSNTIWCSSLTSKPVKLLASHPQSLTHWLKWLVGVLKWSVPTLWRQFDTLMHCFSCGSFH